MCLQFSWKKGYFFLKLMYACKKMLRLALEYIKNCPSEYRSSLLAAWLVRFWFESFLPPTRDRSYKVTPISCGCSVCLSICALSFVAVVTIEHCELPHLERGTCPKIYSITLSHYSTFTCVHFNPHFV